MASDNFRVRFTSIVAAGAIFTAFAFVVSLHFLWLGIFMAGIFCGAVGGDHFGYYHGRITMLDAELREKRAELASLRATNSTGVANNE